jgi:muramoyltetrapeptide carboxypeptidase
VKLLKPPRLKEGDTIGIVAPSSPVLPLQKELRQGIENLKRLRFKVKEGRTIKLQHRNYMAGDRPPTS